MAKVGDRYIIELDSKMTGKGGTLYGVKDLYNVLLDEPALAKLERCGDKEEEESSGYGFGDAVTWTEPGSDTKFRAAVLDMDLDTVTILTENGTVEIVGSRDIAPDTSGGDPFPEHFFELDAVIARLQGRYEI